MTELQTPIPPQATPPKPKRFRPGDALYAVLSMVFGFFLLKYIFASAPGIALTVTVVLFLGATLLYAALRKKRIAPASVFWAAVITVFSLVFSLTANGFLKGWTVVFEILATAYWVYLTFGNRSAKYPDDMLGFDLLKCLILLPFGNIHQSAAAIGESGRKHRSSRMILYVLVGLAAALIPTLIVFRLLAEGDTTFSNLIHYLFEDVGKIIGNNVACIIFAVPVGMLIFGLLYGAAEQKFTTLLSRRSKDRAAGILRIASPVITCAALTPMLLTYVLFFVSQAGYFLGAFQNLRPEDYTYAEYAREGFFNLCAVCAVNAVMILAVHFLTKRTGKHGYSVIAKIYVILFSLSSIVLAVIALRKMMMYIEQYGLTLSRVYASWFMILLSVFFVILIVKQFAHKFNAMLAGLLAFLILFGGLCLCNVDARIAEYNIHRYLETEERDPEDLDLDMFRYDLSDAAVLAVDKAYGSFNAKEKELADQFFLYCALNVSGDLQRETYAEDDYRYHYSFRSWDLDTARAERILRERCPTYFEETRSAFGWTW